MEWLFVFLLFAAIVLLVLFQLRDGGGEAMAPRESPVARDLRAMGDYLRIVHDPDLGTSIPPDRAAAAARALAERAILRARHAAGGADWSRAEEEATAAVELAARAVAGGAMDPEAAARMAEDLARALRLGEGPAGAKVLWEEAWGRIRRREFRRRYG